MYKLDKNFKLVEGWRTFVRLIKICEILVLLVRKGIQHWRLAEFCSSGGALDVGHKQLYLTSESLGAVLLFVSVETIKILKQAF